MKLEISKEALVHRSTTTDPMLYELTIKGVGNLMEIEFITNRLTKQVSVEPEVKVNFADRVRLTDDQLNDVNNMVKNWDNEKSKNRAIEEFLELSLSLLHLARNKTDFENLYREMADVRLALEHLEFKHGNYQKELNEKLEHNSKISE